MGTKVFTNACGPCIGQWDRAGADKQEKIQLYILLIVTPKEQMVIQTHMPL
jgi:aconitase A